MGILVDGEDLHRVTKIRGMMSKAIEQQLIEIMKKATKLACDFPQRVHDDIISDRFALRMQRY